ncbi:hypothetical protein MNBD_GAMMA03-514 [hydrothermal vent metagenome]|uniref:Glutaredoxin domain-containing protein n=1 Tax=hydrothermal vent metagenome TaxID=652676 RepID=A0A3B0W979_9ZZZZ
MKLILLLVFSYGIYHFYVGSDDDVDSGVSARELEPRCDVILFTTASCPYCKKARNLLITKRAKWCEKDINISTENHKLFKSLGGRGVPLALIGSEVIKGYRESNYIAALEQIEVMY